MDAADADKQDDKKDQATPPGHLVIQVCTTRTPAVRRLPSTAALARSMKMVEAVYTKLQLEPKPDDRLTCHATGEDVRQYGDMHLREYASGKCSELVWTFVRDTGGAGA